MNTQPFKMVLIRDKEKKEQLACCMDEGNDTTVRTSGATVIVCADQGKSCCKKVIHRSNEISGWKWWVCVDKEWVMGGATVYAYLYLLFRIVIYSTNDVLQKHSLHILIWMDPWSRTCHLSSICYLSCSLYTISMVVSAVFFLDAGYCYSSWKQRNQ